jgi:two-component system NtrC family response regulator
MPLIMLVEDEPSLQLALGDTLADEGYDVLVAGTLEEAITGLARPIDLVLSDFRLPDGTGFDVLRAVQNAFPDVPVVLLTAYGTVPGAVEAIRSGAAEYITKPFENLQLLALVRRHLELRNLRQRVAELEGAARSPLGQAPAFRKALELARTVAASDSTVLLHGETGTGKEVVARFIHEVSPRRERAFVPLNCAALPETLLESELFGHERGAFTGAVTQRRGRFEEADGGTLFLDEIAETSPQVQAKLLRSIESQKFERLGSSKEIKVDVRLLAATKRDIAEEVAAGRFRDDLYYRLKVVPITLPPLRERVEDIPLLAQFFARRYAAERGRAMEFSPEALEKLSGHSFPGNVRELKHLVQRLAVTVSDETLRADHLPEEYRSPAAVRVTVDQTSFTGTLSEMSEALERKVLKEVLERFDGHRGKAAEALGVSRKNLWEKLKAYGLKG